VKGGGRESPLPVHERISQKLAVKKINVMGTMSQEIRRGKESGNEGEQGGVEKLFFPGSGPASDTKE